MKKTVIILVAIILALQFSNLTAYGILESQHVALINTAGEIDTLSSFPVRENGMPVSCDYLQIKKASCVTLSLITRPRFKYRCRLGIFGATTQAIRGSPFTKWQRLICDGIFGANLGNWCKSW